MSDFDGAAMSRFVSTFADRLHERREELTQLDSAVGDADHGINMDRGFSAARAKLAELGEADLGTMAKTVGMTLISTVGGASGPLYGTFFLRLSTSLGERDAASTGELGAALRAALDGVQQRGKAIADDKTMVDALLPAVEAFDAASGDGIGPALAAAAQAAAAGRERITPLVARKGRASYLGERAMGHPDPGATSTTILFESLRDAVAAD
ncbi:MAG TPA: dihydroxyacetone kinase subunit DhaL [Candidatus Limnocylindria bacterium]|nr:dihydroxyacetone kinase subunit DhaL [Candidatus Limnocylindria bacterium]